MRKAILVVDDNNINLQVTSSILSQGDYAVTSVLSGERALKALSKLDIDLVLLDYMMPGMDGKDTLREIRKMEKCKDIPVIFLTSEAEDVIATKVTDLAYQGCISKKDTAEEMLGYLNRFFERLAISK